ncbi:MAG: hypothetical protein OXU54_06085 [Gammaproteobacteria bacterium]|nr:hypothetical protein [Gammaproteobacteria bacterium]
MSDYDKINRILDRVSQNLDRVSQKLDRTAQSHARAESRLAKMEAFQAEMQAEAAAQQRAHSKNLDRLEKTVAQLAQKIDKQHARLGQLERTVDRVSKIVGGMGETQGRLAEEFIYEALQKAPRIGDLEFDVLHMNFKATHREKSAEYDLVMTNGEFAAIVAIKHKLHRNDVEKMRTVLLPNFRYLLHQLSDKTLVPVVAGMTADPDAIALAHECGYAVLLPDGQKIREDTTHLRYIPQQG